MAGPLLTWLLLLQVTAFPAVATADEACILDDPLTLSRDAALLQVKRSTTESEHVVPTEDASLLAVAQRVSVPGCQPGLGLTEELDEDGFNNVQAKCCTKDMAAFIRRMIEKGGDGVCDQGGLMGLAIWYDCDDDDGEAGQDFASLLNDIGPNSQARIGECPWIGKGKAPDTTCPAVSPRCFAQADRCAEAAGMGSDEDLTATEGWDGAFLKIQEKCCSKEMAAFIKRMIEKGGDGVCDQGGLMGLAIWYDCDDDGVAGQDFASLEKDIGPSSQARIGECPWIGKGKPPNCPPKSPRCFEAPCTK